MDRHAKIYLAGHTGLVGSALLRALAKAGHGNVVTRELAELDLTRQAAVEDFFAAERPEYVFLAAARVGGIMANDTYPAEFIHQNLMISANVIHAAHAHGARKLLNLGSSCIYPRLAPQPMREDALLAGPLEPTNEAYAVAKIAAIKMCAHYRRQYGSNFLSVMPTNQYGPGDNFNMETAHLLPMVLRRFHLAKLLAAGDFAAIRRDVARYRLGWGLDGGLGEADDGALGAALAEVGAFPDRVVLWGDGSPYRELMHSDDLADACVYVMREKDAADVGELVNITGGDDIRLRDLFALVKEVVGFAGRLEYDGTKPNGTPRKRMDATRIRALGWRPRIGLAEGVRAFYDWYRRA
jgi:GDP-L-fucose synthase